MRTLSKRPEDRFQRASELGAALLGALIAGASSAPPSSVSRPRGSSYPGLPQPPAPYGPQGYDPRQQPGRPGQPGNSGRQPRPRPANPSAPISSLSSLSSPMPAWRAPVPSLPDLTHLARTRETSGTTEPTDHSEAVRPRSPRASQPSERSTQPSYATEALPRLDLAGQPPAAARTPTLAPGLSQASHASLAADTSVSSRVTPRPFPAAQPPTPQASPATLPGRADAPTGPGPVEPARSRLTSGPRQPLAPPQGALRPGDPQDPRQQSIASQASSYFSGASPAAASDPWLSLQSGQPTGQAASQATGRATRRLGQMPSLGQGLGHGVESAPTGAMGALGWSAAAARPQAPTALAYPSSPTLPTLPAGSPPASGLQSDDDLQDSQALLNDVAAQPTLTAPLASFWRNTGAPADSADALDVARTILPGPISAPRVPQRAAQSTRRQRAERELQGAGGRDRGQMWALVTTLLIILLLMAGVLLRWLQTGGPMFFH